MESFWLVAIAVFIVVTLIIWGTTRDRFKKEIGKRAWRNWSTQTYYWQSAIYLSTGITIVILFILKWSNLVSF